MALPGVTPSPVFATITGMDLAEAITWFPHLASPATLARADTDGRWTMAPHLRVINRTLMDVAFSGGGSRVMINLPFQHGKSTLAAHYYPAWTLLLFPHTPIVLVSRDDDYAISFGRKVRDVIARFGPDLGITLRADTKAKGKWVIQGTEGGMTCRGPGSGVTGEPAGLFLIDDLIKGPEQALSPVILDSHWEFYKTVVFARLRTITNLVVIGTRWGSRDLFGRLLEQAKRTKETWQHLRFPAIATEKDALGRRPGDPLWPQQVSLAHLEIARQEYGRWWHACWQQDPQDAEGVYFKPQNGDGSYRWPLYVDTGDAYSLQHPGAASSRRVLLHSEFTRIVTMDWAWSEKKSADYTVIGVFGLTDAGDLLILDVVRQRVPLANLAFLLDTVCRRWHPHIVGVEVGPHSLVNECRRYPAIPELRIISPDNQSKLVRAMPAINMGDNGKLYLPATATNWLMPFISEIAAFTGLNDEHDDQVDVLAYAAHIAQMIRPQRRQIDDWPDLLTPGKATW